MIHLKKSVCPFYRFTEAGRGHWRGLQVAEHFACWIKYHKLISNFDFIKLLHFFASASRTILLVCGTITDPSFKFMNIFPPALNNNRPKRKSCNTVYSKIWYVYFKSDLKLSTKQVIKGRLNEILWNPVVTLHSPLFFRPLEYFSTPAIPGKRCTKTGNFIISSILQRHSHTSFRTS